MNKATGILLLASTVLVSAQSLMGVRYPGGLGTTKSGYASRMGGGGTGSDEPYQLMAYNPGNLGNINQSVYTLKLGIGFTRVTENGVSGDFARLTPDLVGFAFPLGAAGTFGVSFSKEKGNDYFYKSAEKVIATNPVTHETLKGWTGYSRKSGITVWEAGWGHSALKLIRPGISYRRFYYSIDDYQMVKVNGIGGTGDSVDYKQAGNAVRGGISGTVGKVTYGVSGTYNFGGALIQKRSATVIDSSKSSLVAPYVSSLIHDSAAVEREYKMKLPPSGSVGVSYKSSEKLSIAADVSMELWEQAWSTAPKTVFYTSYRNALTASAGAQFIPAPELISPRYFEKVRYSGGARFAQLPVKGDWEFALNTGVGLPVGTSGLIDLGFEGGVRKSDELADVSEKFFKINISTSGGKPWKKKPAQVY